MLDGGEAVGYQEDRLAARCSGRVSKIERSTRLSNEAVGSSRIRISGSLTKARASDRRCFCPSERLTPRSPTSAA